MEKRLVIRPDGVIPIGVQGENEAIAICFPVVEEFREKYGEGSFTGVHRRPNDSASYPIAISVEEGDAVWVIKNYDNYKAGIGSFELVYTVDNVVAKTRSYKTSILPSSSYGEDIPAEYQDWVDRVIAEAEQAKVAGELATEALLQINEEKDAALEAMDTAKESAVNAIVQKGRETLASIPEDYSQLSESITETKADLTELNSKLGFDSEGVEDITGQLITGTGIDVRNGNERHEATNGLATDFIDVSDSSATYYYTGWVYFIVGIAGYDANKNYVANILGSEAGTNPQYTHYALNIPSNVKYIRASSISYSTVHFDLKIEKKKQGNSIVNRVEKLEENKGNTKVVHVSGAGSDTDGDGSFEKPYATIYHANEVITDNDFEHRYVIKVDDGIYTDLQSRYAGTRSGQYEGIICKDYVEYIGNELNPEKCIIKWDGTTGFDKSAFTIDDAFDKAPFHIAGKSLTPCHTKISGFKFVCNDIRYPIHCETQGWGLNVKWEIANCDFTGWTGRPQCIANQSGHTRTQPSIGMGSTCGEVGEIHHCKFPARPSGEIQHLGIVNHDNVPKTSDYATTSLFGATYYIHDCNFNNNDILVRSSYTIDYDTPNHIKVENCTNIKSLFHWEENSPAKNNWCCTKLSTVPQSGNFN